MGIKPRFVQGGNYHLVVLSRDVFWGGYNLKVIGICSGVSPSRPGCRQASCRAAQINRGLILFVCLLKILGIYLEESGYVVSAAQGYRKRWHWQSL